MSGVVFPHLLFLSFHFRFLFFGGLSRFSFDVEEKHVACQQSAQLATLGADQTNSAGADRTISLGGPRGSLPVDFFSMFIYFLNPFFLVFFSIDVFRRSFSLHINSHVGWCPSGNDIFPKRTLFWTTALQKTSPWVTVTNQFCLFSTTSSPGTRHTHTHPHPHTWTGGGGAVFGAGLCSPFVW